MRRMHIAIAMVLMMLPVGAAFAGLSGPTPIPNPPNFYVTSSLTSVCKGQINYVPITVQNTGGSSTVGTQSLSGAVMDNVQLNVIDSKTAFAIKNSTVGAGNINVTMNSTAYVPVFVASNASTLVSMQFGITYYYLSIYSDSESRNLTFGTRVCEQPLSVSVNPAELISGTINNATLSFVNSGPTPLNSISTTVAFPTTDASWLSALPVSIASVPAQSTVNVPARIYVYKNASQSFYANITSTFYNGTGLGQLSTSQSVLASGGISLTPSSYTISPQQPTPGSTFSISFVLTDIGTSTAGAVTVAPVAVDGFAAFGGANSVFVGDISADSQIPVTVTLVASNATKPGSYTIPLKVNYLNGLRQNQSTEVNVPITVARQFAALPAGGATQIVTRNGTAYAYRSGSSGGGALIIVILAVATIVLAYLYMRERRRKSR